MRKMILGALLVLAGGVWGANENWAKDLWLGRDGWWRERVSFAVSNPTTNVWDGQSVALHVGAGSQRLPLVGASIESLRLVDAFGVQLEYGVWSAQGARLTRGTVPADATVIVPAACAGKSAAIYTFYWNNPSAWGLMDFWPEAPTQAVRDAPLLVAAPERLAVTETGATSVWAKPEAGRPWCWRVPVRLCNFTDTDDPPALTALTLAEAAHAARHPRFRLEFDGQETPVVVLDRQILFTAACPARTVRTGYLYVREDDAETPAASASATSVLGSEIPSDQRLVAEAGLAPHDFVAFRKILTGSANLLANPSFEQNGLAGWTRSGSDAYRTEASQTGALFDKVCTRLEVPSAARGEWRGVRQRVKVRPNRAYFIGAFIAGENLTQAASVHVHVHAGAKTLHMGATGGGKTGTFGWTPHFGVFRSGAQADAMSVHLTMNGQGVLKHDGAFAVEFAEALVGAPETPPFAPEAPDFVAQPISTTRKVFRETPVVDVRTPFAFALARRETEELQVAVRARRDVAQFTARLSALVNAKGAALPVEVGYVDYVKVDWPTAYYSKRTPERELRFPTSAPNCDGWTGWWPDPIVPKATCALTAGEARAFRFSVTTSAETEPGVYAGEIVWLADGREVRRDKVACTVWNFTLPTRPEIPAVYDVRLGNAAWRKPGEKDDAAARARVHAFLAKKKLCPDHVPAEPKFTRAADGSVKADFTAWDRAAKTYFDEHGFAVAYMPTFYCFGWGHPPHKFLGEEPYEGQWPWKDVDRAQLRPAWKSVYAQALKLFWEHEKAAGRADRFVLYISDEPYFDDPKIVAQMQALCRVIQSVDPKIRIYSSTWRHCPAWDGYINLWGIGHYGCFPTETMKACRGKGAEYWFTTDGQECLDTVYATTERLFPHYCAAWGAGAYEFWGGTWLTYDPWECGFHAYIRQSGTPGDTFWSRYPAGDGYLIYPPKPGVCDGLASSVRLEAARDGVEDYSYLKALERLGPSHAAAQALLAEFRALVTIPNPGGRYSSRVLPDPEVLDRLRARAGELLSGVRK